jgi:hypothetical protein
VRFPSSRLSIHQSYWLRFPFISFNSRLVRGRNTTLGQTLLSSTINVIVLLSTTPIRIVTTQQQTPFAMVSYRAPSDQSSSTPSSPSSPKMVNFAGVTGMSRAATNEEQWAFYAFEAHAADCRSCEDPYTRYRANKRLCREGNKLALIIDRLVYCKDSKVYSRVREDGQKVNVEIPPGYDRTSSLLKAVEKGSRNKHKFLSFEKSTEHTHASREQPHLSARGHSPPKAERIVPHTTSARGHHSPTMERIAPVHTTTIPYTALPIRQPVQLPELNPFAEAAAWEYHVPMARRYTAPAESTSKRGSLYETDILRMMARDQREGQLGYKLEVREPTRHHSVSSRSGHHRHRHSGIFF